MQPRFSHLSAIIDSDGTPLDYGLITYFKAPNSYTGEDCAEFSLHGSPFILKKFLELLSSLSARLARPGEFTERAFLNGKIDLAQAEAVSDLIVAETESQAKLAREQLEGKLSGALTELGSPLRELLAEIEAYIDFPDEDIEPLRYDEWSAVIESINSTVNRFINSYSSGKLIRDGASVVLIGLPNVGKSTLLNSLIGEDRAIVTSIPGTTRDSIEERLSLNGLLIRLFDTAGLAELGGRTPDEVERLGIERSWKKAEEADLIVFVFDCSQSFEKQIELLNTVKAPNRKILLVGNKADLSPTSNMPEKLSASILISAKLGTGLHELRDKIYSSLVTEQRDSLLICSERHLNSLKTAEIHLTEALQALEYKVPPEFISVNIRAALVALESIIGVTSTDEILGLIFSKFCIGK